MYKIIIEIPFRAGHRLLPPYKGKCNNVHGEGYTAIIEFTSDKLDENGMVLDFGKIKKQVKEWIDENWDHTYICHYKDSIAQILMNEHMRVFTMDNNPTAENMAKYLFTKMEAIGNVTKVGIVESFRDSIAWYEN